MFDIGLKLISKICITSALVWITSGFFDVVRAEVGGLLLSEDEKKLALDIKFDVSALEIVKAETGTAFEKIDINSMDSLSGNMIVLNQLSESLKQKWILKLEQIKNEYPELGASVDSLIEHTRKEACTPIGSQSLSESQKKRLEILNEYQPYIRQEFEKIRHKLPHGASVMWNADLPHLKNNDELLATLKKQFDGVVLEEKFKPEFGLKISLPFDSSMVAQEIALQKKLDGSESKFAQMPSSAFYGSTPTEICTKLNSKLNPLGYTVYGGNSVKRDAQFYDLTEAKNWLKSFDNKLIYSEITESPPFTFEYDFDPQAPQAPFQQFNLAPFSSITKVSKGKWKVTTSKSFTVHTILFQAVLSKTGKDANSKFNPIVSAGTSGCNYAVSNEMIIERLQKWDKLYGVKLRDAKNDSFSIEFEKLPEDLSHLCTEMWLFCPDLLDLYADDFEQKASVMKDFARKLKETKTVSFWWD